MADINIPAKVNFVNAKSTNFIKFSIFPCNSKAASIVPGSFNSMGIDLYFFILFYKEKASKTGKNQFTFLKRMIQTVEECKNLWRFPNIDKQITCGCTFRRK